MQDASVLNPAPRFIPLLNLAGKTLRPAGRRLRAAARPGHSEEFSRCWGNFIRRGVWRNPSGHL